MITLKFRNTTPLLSVDIADVPIQPVTSARNLGVIVANDLNMDVYISNICRSPSYALYKIGRIRNLLDEKLTETLVHAFITCHLDRCNSLLYGLPDTLIAKLQRIQNSAARLVTRTRGHDHITPVLCNLHWLPVKYRIIYKILLLTYKIRHVNATKSYLHFDRFAGKPVCVQIYFVSYCFSVSYFFHKNRITLTSDLN